MDALKEKVYWAELFAIYQNLLTEKQQDYFNLTINEDLSLQEIASTFNVSRNAVHDANQTTEKLLEEFENKLQILTKRTELEKILDQYSKTKSEEVQTLVKKIKEVL